MICQMDIDKLFVMCRQGTISDDNLEMCDIILTIRDTDNLTLLDIAIERHDYDTITKLLKKRLGSSVSVKDASLCRAVKTGVCGLVELILSHIHDTDSIEYDECVATACASGFFDVLRLLLRKCPDVELEEPFRLACINGHVAIVRELLSLGVTSHQDYRGNLIPDILRLSTNTNVATVLECLIANHAFIDVECSRTLSAAALGGVDSVIKQVITAGTHDARMVVSAMENACQGGHIEIVKYLMSIANTHGYDIDLIRVINVAMQYQHIHITRYLFEIIASTVTYKRYYKYILWAAVKHGCAEIADILIDSRNVDVNQSVCGRSLLSHAYVQSTVNKLLLAKADINPASSRSVLTAACDKLVPESVKALIEARAEVNSDRLLSSPLWSAMGATDGEKHADHQETVINLLLRAGARTRPLKGRGSILHDCIMTLGSEHALRVVSMHDPSLLECRDSADLTPLMLTTLYKLPSMVKALVDAGADAGAYSGESTPLIFHLFTSGIMAWTDKLPRRIRDTLRLLLDAGADPMACDGDDNTLLTVCMGCDLFMHVSYDCTWVFVSDILAAVAAKLQFPDTSAHLPV